MELTRLSAKHFGSHLDTSFSFTDRKPYLFIGSNGSGKSLFVGDLISFVFFGATRMGGAGDSLITNTSKHKEDWMSGESEFYVGGVLYKITRKRNKNKINYL